MAARFKVGAWLMPQHTSVERLRAAWREADRRGVDSIWLWDHFYPLTGEPDGTHFEGWTLLAAMAVETSRADVGVLVTDQDYRNPDLLADMARTVDHLSGGRLVLGLGAGWFERDYAEYGYEFRPGPERAEALEGYVERVKARLAKLNPPPLGEIPLMIGGDGKRVVLRTVARHADAWNTMAWRFEEGNGTLDEWCARLDRDPAEIERSCFLTAPEHLDQVDRLVAAGARHIIMQVGDPFDLGLVDRLLSLAQGPAA
ncbi:LLM class F420-dependent oxidoreductase [Sphaerisporangium krabiense]|uniref:Putative F420-dependent oxidoreductase n=1 Tax=Sphaerisporangium krabiense TaxID=763782 RepID=A0A7W8Z6K5_9ACTN|nr:LLM class F420-dependent oxidoreductase [Sphaerisporangium krabiense]MBB5628428.1 putative F420-dependent oxidoreductase [Sphaerisporangium krabiense]GII66833.1 LLM class F420-dependent oxidoreductase [Sphaerisporangium krabiense]